MKRFLLRKLRQFDKVLDDRKIESLYRDRLRVGYREVDGVRLRVNFQPHEMSPTIVKMILRGAYESKEGAVLRRTVSPSDRILELGTGLGFNAILICKVLRNSNVCSYEANPDLIPIIRDNMRLNQVEFDLRHALPSLGPAAEKLPFHKANDFLVSSTKTAGGGTPTLMVPTEDILRTVDERRINYLVCDIEGGEEDILQSALLSRIAITKLLVEWHPHVLGRARMSQLLASVLQHGFLLDEDLSGGQVMYFYRETAAQEGPGSRALPA